MRMSETLKKCLQKRLFTACVFDVARLRHHNHWSYYRNAAVYETVESWSRQINGIHLNRLSTVCSCVFNAVLLFLQSTPHEGDCTQLGPQNRQQRHLSLRFWTTPTRISTTITRHKTLKQQIKRKQQMKWNAVNLLPFKCSFHHNIMHPSFMSD